MPIPAATLHDFCAALFRAAGSDALEAEIVAAHLVEANLVGHDSHGAIRAPKYVDWVAAGELVPNRHATTILDAGALLLVDGSFGYGQVIGFEAMTLVAERARRHGAAILGIRNSGHLGRIGAWPEQLAAAGLVSLHFVNTSGYGILVAPHGGTERRLSANPIAVGAPGPDGPLVLDIATSATAEGKIQVARNQGAALPAGQVLDGHGLPTTDPAAFYGPPEGAILPFGGHKGSGLSFFCELLAGSLTGGGASSPTNPSAWRLVNNMLTIALDPAALAGPDFFGMDAAKLAAWVRSARPATPGGEILLPGEIEAATRARRLAEGIPLDMVTRAQMADAAHRFGVARPAELAHA
jgi:uncharacterized oxidoreductase